MREIIYKYSSLGAYFTEDNTDFGGESQLKIVIEPHDFSISVGDEVLRSSSLSGYTAVVSCDGEAVFYNNENEIIAKADKSEKRYKSIRVNWKGDLILLEFGYVSVVDYYPNCDGESDRWGEEWVAEHTVLLNIKANALHIK